MNPISVNPNMWPILENIFQKIFKPVAWWI